jgi:cell surface protein SprA
MRYSVISSVLIIAFFIGCDDKECDPVSPPIDARVSFEISFLDYSDNNYFIDEVYADTSSELNMFNLYYGNIPSLFLPKYSVKDIEVYLSISTSYQNSIYACAYVNLPSRTVSQKYSDSLRYISNPIVGSETAGRFRLLHEGRDYFFHSITGYITFIYPITDLDEIAVAYKVENDSPLPTDDLIYGEFFTDLISNSDSIAVLKLIKPRNLFPQMVSAWKLKLKNHYQISPYIGQVTDLDLDIYLKRADGTESNLINNVRLLELFGLDKLNADVSPGADGKFDYRPGITFRPQTSEIIFPVIEPFGNNIPSILSEYKYQAIYDTFKTLLTLPDNRFIIKGKYKPL